MSAAPSWEPVIGLEVHVQLATKSKAFSPSATRFGEPPNSLTDPLVLGMPGTLPVFNRGALELAMRLGLAVASTIRRDSRFARKHYFYPDLPKGYQISQYEEPLCEGGALDVITASGTTQVALQRIHLEEDAGKSMHHGQTSHVDLNRAGIPLVEVVTAPVIGSAEQAAEFMRSLHRLVRWLGVSEADMEKGQMRCDANVSVRRPGAELGTRTELKNINSFRFVKHAIEHEIARQCRILDGGGRIERETRLWDAVLGTSAPMRSKEEANDYRYFPDPDLPVLVVTDAELTAARAALPELPADVAARLVAHCGLSTDDAHLVVGDRALTTYYDAALTTLTAAGADAAQVGASHGKALANWLLTELLGALNRDGKDIVDAPLPPAALAELVALISDETISGKMAKEIFAESYKTGEAPRAIVERTGLRQLSDPAELGAIIDDVLGKNPKNVEGYKAGKDALFGSFVGAVMKATGGRANPRLTSDLLKQKLGR